MSSERQSSFRGLDPDDHFPSDPGIDGIVDESPASESPATSSDPAGSSSSTPKQASLDHGQAVQNGDARMAGWEDTGDSEPPVPAPLSEDGAGEYPISSWALLSPEMPEELTRLFEEDVERNGVRVPVDVVNGEIIDGRHREAAGRKTGKSLIYNLLPDDTDVLSHLLSVNGIRGHHDENERAIYAYELWKNQFLAAGLKPGKGSANLRNFKSQEEIARLLNVSPRSVSSVSSVLSDGSTASSALKEAVLKRQVKASDAQRVLNKPAVIQRQAVAMAVRGGASTVLAAARMVERDKSREEARQKERRPSSRLADRSIKLYQSSVSQMTGRVAEGSVDAIITFPSPDPNTHERFVELATFAAHALKPEGVMAVLTSGLQLPFVIERLTHPDLKWMAEFDYRPPNPSRSGPPMNLTLKRWPLLIYGKRRFHL